VIDEDAPRPCVKCGSAVLDVAGEPETDGCVFAATIKPVDDGEDYAAFRELEIGLCARCLSEAGKAGRVLLRTTVPVEPDVSLWLG
jgi:hypothetical protein